MELVTTYSKRDDLLYDLELTSKQLAKARLAGEVDARASVQSTGRIGHKHGLQERLTEDDLHQIVMRYEGGELRQAIADRYGISVSSVARVLRAHRAAT